MACELIKTWEPKVLGAFINVFSLRYKLKRNQYNSPALPGGSGFKNP